MLFKRKTAAEDNQAEDEEGPEEEMEEDPEEQEEGEDPQEQKNGRCLIKPI